MSKILKFFSLILTGLLFFSCSNSDDNSEGGNSSISALIGSQGWSTSVVAGSVVNYEFGGESLQALQVLATKENGSALTFRIPITDITAGSHTYSENTEGLMTYMSPLDDLYSSDETGGAFTINITSINHNTGRITGTFTAFLYTADGARIEITQGNIDNVLFISNDLYKNGTMTLTRNAGTPFVMDDNSNDGKFLLISQNSGSNGVYLFGNNANVSSDFGIYNLYFPKNVTVGTYNLATDNGFGATIGNAQGQAEFNITSGSLSITSRNGNNVIGTFNFTVNNGTQTVTITDGSFNITHK